MPSVSKTDIAQARQIDLLSYMLSTDPGNLKRVGAGEYILRNHDSLHVRQDGVWKRFSADGDASKGRSALDYLVKVENISFVDAVRHLLGETIFVVAGKPEIAPTKNFTLPPRDDSNDAVFHYLAGRGINPEILNICIEQDILYQSIIHAGSKTYRNCVFVGMDHRNTPRYAFQRGIRKPFYGEAENSDKRFGFKLSYSAAAMGRLFIAESAIDALSYASIQYECDPEHWDEQTYLSLGGVSPLAMFQTIKDSKAKPTVLLGLDKDEAGRSATKSIAHLLEQEGYRVKDVPPPRGKDYNRYLQMERAIERKAHHHNEMER